MVDYTAKICEACSADASEATNKEIEEFLQKHQEWFISTDVDFPQLQRIYIFKNFSKAQVFANLVGDLAEKEGHHPTILLEYGKVTIRWWSHKIRSIHINDFILSSKTEKIYGANR